MWCEFRVGLWNLAFIFLHIGYLWLIFRVGCLISHPRSFTVARLSLDSMSWAMAMVYKVLRQTSFFSLSLFIAHGGHSIARRMRGNIIEKNLEKKRCRVYA